MAREAEVDQDRLVAAQEDVAGFQIEMNYVLSMEVVQRECDLHADRGNLVRW